MSVKKTVAIVLSFILFTIFLALITRTNGFFVQFKTEAEVEDFLLTQLEPDTSSVIEVQELMEDYISNWESCEFLEYSLLPGPDLPEEYDDIVLFCDVLSENTWSISPITHWYYISFNFKNEILKKIDITHDSVGF